ncbi:hypothetical protein H4R20_001223 [Coemansia guatemalensis]|uniref:CNH domain-containing protein n=1 Tax=Coemansia guatemalensis TaxID=2761395 RepID=A0A9W8HZZ8_9FUNG|nr:hypothetical protein H4R20_001223 [Coemansia guatemalensis]
MEAQSKDGQGEDYILQTLALGLELEDNSTHTAPGGSSLEETKRRRPSLSQRLGLQGTTERVASPGSDTSSKAQASSPDKQTEAGEAFDTAGAGTAQEELSSARAQSSQSPVPSTKQRGPKIECVEVAGSDVYVGTSNGHVIHYTIETPELGDSRIPEHFKVHTVNLKLGAKRVEQIIAFPALCRLVVLCGSMVVFYSIPELRPVSGSLMPTIKGVSCIAFDERVSRSTASATSLCVARMREINIYRMGSELRLEQEIAIENSVASICMYGSYVCLADTETYKILDLAKVRTSSVEEGQLVLLPTQQPHRDPDTGRVVRPPRPRTLVVGPNEFMFLTSSGDEDTTLGVIVTAMGEALRGTLQFSTYPKAVVYNEPFVVAVFGSGAVEVHDTRSPEQTLSQTFFGGTAAVSELKRPRKLCLVAGLDLNTSVSRPEVIDTSGAATAAGIGSPDEDGSGAFSPSSLHHHATSDLDTTPWTEALGPSLHWRRELIGDGDGSMADVHAGRGLGQRTSSNVIILANDSLYVLTQQPELLRIDTMLKAQRIEEAVLAVDSALASDPSLSSHTPDVAYCLQMAGMICLKNMLVDDALQYFRRGELDPRALLHLFPDYCEPYLGQLLVPFARIPMAAGLRQIFYEIGDVHLLAERSAKQMSGESEEQASMLCKTLEHNVLEMLEHYLEHCRLQMQHHDSQVFSPDAIPVIDTALARLYAENTHSNELRALIETPNNAIVGDMACKYLLKSQHYYYCSLIHISQDDPAAALDIWRRILQGEYEDNRFGGLPEYLAYVVRIDNQELLLEEYLWIITHNVDASLQLLAHLSDASVTSIDADRVIRSIEAEGHDWPLRTFIERLISAGHSRATHYMTYLVNVYVRQIRDYYLKNTDEARARKDALETNYRCAQAEKLSLTFRAFLKDFCGKDEGAGLREQLVEFLSCRPPSYDPAVVLECIESEAGEYLLIERAILLVVMDREDDAVELLVNKYGDYAEAELLLLKPNALVSLAQLNPHRQHHNLSHSDMEEAEANQNQLGTTETNVRRLLTMYLRLGDTDDDMAARLVSDILSKYAGFINMDILQEIPDHWPYSITESFVRRGLGALNNREQASAIERSLCQARAFDTQLDYVEATSTHMPISLDYSQTCAKCKKLLGSSAFVYAPDTEEVKHISCA